RGMGRERKQAEELCTREAFPMGTPRPTTMTLLRGFGVGILSERCTDVYGGGTKGGPRARRMNPSMTTKMTELGNR
ncbi:hypothetical protein BHE74_00019783, partial [Ensete ventricosum]